MCRTAWPIPRKRTERARTRSRHHGKCIAPPRQMHRDTTANASRPCGAPTGGGRAAGGGFCRSARNGRERVRDTTANASRHHGKCIATPRQMHRDTTANASRHHGECIAPLRCAPTGGRAAGGGFCRSARNGRERVRDTTANASRHRGKCIATPWQMHRAPAVRSYKGRALRAVVFVGAHGTGANAFATPRQMHRDTTANASRPCGALLQGGRAAGGGFCRSARNWRERVRDTAANASRHHGKCIAPLRCAPPAGSPCSSSCSKTCASTPRRCAI